MFALASALQQEGSAAAEAPGLRILIVDDHAIVREGMKRILESTPERWSITEAANGFEALERLRGSDVDLAVVDLSLPGMPGLDLIKRIHDEFAHVHVLVLSMHAQEQYALRAFRLGASGYLTKDGAVPDLVHAVRKIAAGGIYVMPGLAERVVAQLHRGSPEPAAGLSDRELQVLQRIVAGQRVSDIAQALHLSAKTVSTHKSRIQEKLGLPGTAALVRWAVEQGIGGPPA